MGRVPDNFLPISKVSFFMLAYKKGASIEFRFTPLDLKFVHISGQDFLMGESVVINLNY
jgi:hypothetical protein